MKPTILVTAAGGKTGMAVAKQLLARDYPVRALLRRRDARAATLERAGAAVVIGNMLDPRDLAVALEGVQRAYYCAPVEPNGLHTGMAFACAAQEARLEVAVVMSQWLAHATHPTVATRETWLANRAFDWLPGVDVVTVNPGWFADNYFFVLAPIAQLGLMPMSLGQGLNAPPSNEDIAAVVVGALADPAPHVGKRYRPTGPRLLSPEDIAATFAKVLGRPVRYRDISERLFLKALRAQDRPPFAMSQLRHYVEDYRRNAFAIGAPDHGGAGPGRPRARRLRDHRAALPRGTPGSQGDARQQAGNDRLLRPHAGDPSAGHGSLRGAPAPSADRRSGLRRSGVGLAGQTRSGDGGIDENGFPADRWLGSTVATASRCDPRRSVTPVTV